MLWLLSDYNVKHTSIWAFLAPVIKMRIFYGFDCSLMVNENKLVLSILCVVSSICNVYSVCIINGEALMFNTNSHYMNE